MAKTDTSSLNEAIIGKRERHCVLCIVLCVICVHVLGMRGHVPVR